MSITDSTPAGIKLETNHGAVLRSPIKANDQANAFSDDNLDEMWVS